MPISDRSVPSASACSDTRIPKVNLMIAPPPTPAMPADPTAEGFHRLTGGAIIQELIIDHHPCCGRLPGQAARTVPRAGVTPIWYQFCYTRSG